MPGDLSQSTQLEMAPIVDVDVFRFERSLLRIGFFAAQEERKGNQSKIRRMEITVNRDGQRIDTVIQFEGTRGLPSTADRDKFIAFMRIVDEQRARYGHVSNPIRFSGYRLLTELGLCDSGENYEDLNAWGQRMVHTSITSKQVIFLAKSRRYADKSLNVFESFERAGKEHGTTRSEEFEVILTSWMLDNLNANYVYIEDYAPYKKLKRPIAKGIYGLLHWWFMATEGRTVEKDYKQLCMLLGIKTFTYISKIQHSIGKSLDELISVGYLSKWDIQPMASKDGYKIVLWPGKDILRRLAPELSSSKNSGLLTSSSSTAAEPIRNADLGREAQQALDALLTFGVAPKIAKDFVARLDPSAILDTIDYVSSLATLDKKGRIQNPSGLLIYYLRGDSLIPEDFLTIRKRRAIEKNKRQDENQRMHSVILEREYSEWRAGRVDDEIAKRYPGDSLKQKINQVVEQTVSVDKLFVRIPLPQRPIVARQIIAKEIRDELELPSFEDWCKAHPQRDLFHE